MYGILKRKFMGFLIGIIIITSSFSVIANADNNSGYVEGLNGDNNLEHIEEKSESTPDSFSNISVSGTGNKSQQDKRSDMTIYLGSGGWHPELEKQWEAQEIAYGPPTNGYFTGDWKSWGSYSIEMSENDGDNACASGYFYYTTDSYMSPRDYVLKYLSVGVRYFSESLFGDGPEMLVYNWQTGSEWNSGNLGKEGDFVWKWRTFNGWSNAAKYIGTSGNNKGKVQVRIFAWDSDSLIDGDDEVVNLVSIKYRTGDEELYAGWIDFNDNYLSDGLDDSAHCEFDVDVGDYNDGTQSKVTIQATLIQTADHHGNPMWKTIDTDEKTWTITDWQLELGKCDLDAHAGGGTAGYYKIKLTLKDEFGNNELTPTTYYTDAFMLYPFGPPNDPPLKPSTPVGPNNGDRNILYSYTTSTTDPDNDQIKYIFDWGDGTPQTITTLTPSGQTVTVQHSWKIAGAYQIKVQAEDEHGLKSIYWSDPLTITIDNHPPDKPSTPSGPGTVDLGFYESYSTSSEDPENDNIKYKFNWGDGDSDWTGYYDSGDAVYMDHSWSTPGNFYISVMAQDKYGASSSWSNQKMIYVKNTPPYNPQKPDNHEIGWINTYYYFKTKTTDYNGDNVKYGWDWNNDGTVDTWTGFYSSGQICSVSHYWDSIGEKTIKVMAKDTHGGESSWSEISSILIIEHDQNVPDLSVPTQDVIFYLQDGKINMDFNATNTGTYTQNIKYEIWKINIYTNKEEQITSNTIPELNEMSSIDISLNLNMNNKDAEKYLIKIIIDPPYTNHPTGDIYEGGEDGEGNNVIILPITLGLGYILTNIDYEDSLYYLVFEPKTEETVNQIMNKFKDLDLSFVDEINRLWIVDSRYPYIEIENDNNIVGEILFKVIQPFKVNAQYYEPWSPYHDVEDAEKIGDFVRNAWFLDILAPDNWVEWIQDYITGADAQKEKIEMISAMLLSLCSEAVPTNDPSEQALGLEFTLLSMVLTCHSQYKTGSVGKSWGIADLKQLGRKFDKFLENSYILFKNENYHEIVYPEQWLVQDGVFKLRPKVVIQIVNGEVIEPSGIGKEIAQMIKNNYKGLLRGILKECLSADHKKINFKEINRYIMEKDYYSVLNRLRVLHDTLVIYSNDNQDYTDLIEASEGLITLMETAFDSFVDIYIDPNPDTFAEKISPYMDIAADCITSIGVKNLIKTSVRVSLEYAFRHGVTFGAKIGSTTAASAASIAAFVVEGLDMGFTLSNWLAVRKEMDVAKLATSLGHYTLDIPAYILSSNLGVNDESYYSNAIWTTKLLANGFSYYETSKAVDSTFFGLPIGDLPKIKEEWKRIGDQCYDEVNRAYNTNTLFSLFNKMAVLCTNLNLYSIKAPEFDRIQVGTTANIIGTISWQDGGFSTYNGLGLWRNLMTDFYITEFGNTYVITVNPWENIACSTGWERKEQIDTELSLRFKLWNGDWVPYEQYWPGFTKTNVLHSSEEKTDNKWCEYPLTFISPWEPVYVTMDSKRKHYPLIGDPYYWSRSQSFYLNTPSGDRIISDNIPEEVLKFNQHLGTYFISTIDESRTGDISYYLWDSNYDSLNDALTFEWNLSEYESLGQISISAMIIGGNDSGNASIKSIYFYPNFNIEEFNDNNFTFDFFSNKTQDYDIYLYAMDKSTMDTIDSISVKDIILNEGPGNPNTNKELIDNLSKFTYDSNSDNIIDGLNLNLGLKTSLLGSENCTLSIICTDEDNTIYEINATKYNLSTNILNVSYDITNLDSGNYSVTIYLIDSAHEIKAARYEYFSVGTDISGLFTGEINDYGNDTNSNGLFNFLSLKVGINLEENGNYTLIGTLINSLNQSVCQINKKDTFTTETDYITLNIDSSTLTILNKDDFYKIKTLTLYKDNSLIDEWNPNYQTQYYTQDSFELPEIQLLSMISDQGIDINSDSYYDFLQFDIPLNVQHSGNYSFELSGRANNNGNISVSLWNISNLPVGYNIIKFQADGTTLRYNKLNTSYLIDYVLITYEGNLIGYYYPNYLSAYYHYTDFQQIIVINNAFSEQTLDVNNNDLYDYLKINLNINVHLAGEYNIIAELYDSARKQIDTYNLKSNYLVGSNDISLLFDGSSIYRTLDNTYFILGILKIYDSNGHLIEQLNNSYQTNIYDYSNFEPAEISKCECITDYGIDTNSNGKFEHIEFEIDLEAKKAGEYMIVGQLQDTNNNFIDKISNLTTINTGSNLVTLNLAGIKLISNQDKLNLSLQVTNKDGDIVFINNDFYQTAEYSSDDIEIPTLPDYYINNNDIYPSKNNPENGELIYINANIHSNSEITTNGVIANLYSDAPNETNGVLVASILTSELNQSHPALVKFIWEYHDGNILYIVIDPQNELLEENETNNIASIIFDITPPQIIDNTVDTPYTGDMFNFSVFVSDKTFISTVYVDYYYGQGQHIILQMNRMRDDAAFFEKTITIEHTDKKLNYYFIAEDINKNSYTTTTKSLSVIDNDNPMISNITMISFYKIDHNIVNISCDATDNIKINSIKINIINVPQGFDPIQVNMIKGKGNKYYFNYSFTIQGLYDYYIEALDPTGNKNITVIYQFEICFDITPPVTSKTIGNPKFGLNDYWINSTTSIALSATDDMSGVNKTYYRIWYNGIWTIWIEYDNIIYLQNEGFYYFEYYSTDIAGNIEETHNQSHFVDNSPPTTFISFSSPYYNNQNSEWITNKTQIHLIAMDNPDGGSGVQEIHYTYNNSWNILQEDDVYFTIPNECLHTIKWYALDNLRQVEITKNRDVYVDNTPPNSTIEFGKPYWEDNITKWITPWTPIYINITDYPSCGPSGIKELHFDFTGDSNFEEIIEIENQIGYTTEYSINLSIMDLIQQGDKYWGSHTINVYSIDNLGNTEIQKTFEIKVVIPLHLEPEHWFLDGAHQNRIDYTLSSEKSPTDDYNCLKWVINVNKSDPYSGLSYPDGFVNIYYNNQGMNWSQVESLDMLIYSDSDQNYRNCSKPDKTKLYEIIHNPKDTWKHDLSTDSTQTGFYDNDEITLNQWNTLYWNFSDFNRDDLKYYRLKMIQNDNDYSSDGEILQFYIKGILVAGPMGLEDGTKHPLSNLWSVDQDYTVTDTDGDWCFEHNIQHAVNWEKEDKTITIKPGTYLENVYMFRDNVILQKATKNPIINGQYLGPTLYLAAKHLTIDGFDITHGLTGIYAPGTDNHIIKNCRIFNNTNDGIYMDNSSGHQIISTKINKNNRDGLHCEDIMNLIMNNCEINQNANGSYFIDSENIDFYDDYIHLNNMNGIYAKNTHYFNIDQCIISSNGDDGISLYGCTHINTTKTQIGANRNGIFGDGVSDSLVENCLINNNVGTGLDDPAKSGGGIMFYSLDDGFFNNVFSNNDIHSNAHQGIFIGNINNEPCIISTNNIMMNNQIFENGVESNRYGIHLKNSDYNNIHDNEIYNHYYGDLVNIGVGIVLESSFGNDVKYNYIYGNDEQVRYIGPNNCANQVFTNYINYNFFQAPEGGPCLDTVGVANYNPDIIIDARWNWWNVPDGPSSPVVNPVYDAVTGRIADGLGDEVKGPVNFDPWIGIDALATANTYKVKAGKPVTFSALNSFACHMDGTYYDFKVLWKFGDGGSSTQKQIGHVYKNPGTYNVILQVSATDNSLAPLYQGVMFDWAYLTIVVT